MRTGFSSHRDQWGVLIHYYVKNDVNTLKTNQKMPVGKRDIITFCFVLFCFVLFFFLKKVVNRRKRRLNMIRKNSFKSLCLSVAFENIKMYSN